MLPVAGIMKTQMCASITVCCLLPSIIDEKSYGSTHLFGVLELMLIASQHPTTHTVQQSVQNKISTIMSDTSNIVF